MSIFFAAWMAFAVIVGIAASMRGRVGYGWFLVALVMSPLIVGPLVLALPRQYAEPQTEAGTLTSLSSIFKWFGITILSGCAVAVVMMFIAFVLIIQHGGA
jgi:hypothetical protein